MAEFVESQGTEIYFIDPDSPTAIITMDCPTAISKSGGARNTIEIMCLNATDPEYRSGTRTATTYSVPFALIPTSVNHQRLFDFQESGELVPFLIALSDGTTDPTVASGALVPPTDRSSFSFEALVTDVAIDIQTNDVVRGTLTLQVSGPTTTTWKVGP